MTAPHDVLALLGLAVSDPATAATRAARLLETFDDPWVRSVAHQAHGIVLRDRGDLENAVPELRRGLEEATRSGDADRVADVRATLGAALVMAGRTRSGLAQLDRAATGADDPTLRAKVLMRRGFVLTMIVGRHREAVADLEAALSGIRRSGDRVWEARTLNVVGLAHLALGQVAEADAAVRAAEALFVAEGQDLEAAMAVHNQGVVAYTQGDLPRALAVYDVVVARYAALGTESPELAYDRALALLAAGLVREALDVVTDQLASLTLKAVRRPELLLLLATAQLEDGRPEAALESAREARLGFRRQRRDWWTLESDLALLRARWATGAGGPALVRTAADVAQRLGSERSDQTANAWLLAGRAAHARGLVEASELLEAAAAHRHDPQALVRATGWLARALAAERVGDERGLFAACRRGLDALDEHRSTLGSTELRALATRRGDELASVALRRAADGPPRRLLWWSERWRAVSLAQPPVRPPRDEVLARAQAALRDNGRRLREARSERAPTAALEHERARLEHDLRRRLFHTAGGRATGGTGLDVERLVAEVGDATFVELVEAGGRLLSIVVTRGRVRAFEVGDATEAVHAVEMARFALRQLARGRPVSIGDLGRRLQTALLGPSAAALSEGPVVVSPVGRLHATPWALLPALADLPVSVVPSAALWLRARGAGAVSDRRVLITGPGLASGGAEVTELALRYTDAVVLRGADATVERSLAALDGAGLAHVAAHGLFRPDAPLFSALELDDGPLTVHDFETLHRPPHRLVLSACESGVLQPVGANELLGLSAALLSIGTAGIVSSVVVVNDQATSELMTTLHAGLEHSDDLPAVMLRARRAARGDPVAEATGAAFIAVGA